MHGIHKHKPSTNEFGIITPWLNIRLLDTQKEGTKHFRDLSTKPGVFIASKSQRVIMNTPCCVIHDSKREKSSEMPELTSRVVIVSS